VHSSIVKKPELKKQESCNWSSVRTNGLSGKRCCPRTAQIRLIRIGRRCLTAIVKRPMSCAVSQYSTQNKRSLRRNAAWLDLLRTAPSRNRTTQCSRPSQGEALVVCSMKPVQTAELCLSKPWKSG